LKESKAYPYLKALLDALLEAAPNWAKAPGKFVSTLSEQLKSQGEEKNKLLEKEIQGISEDELRTIIEEAGCDQKENIEFIVGRVKLIPEILQTIGHRFDKVEERLEEIKSILLRQKPVFSAREQHADRDIIQAGGDIIIQQAAEKEKLNFPLEPSLHNQTAPEENFVGRKDMLDTITQWYKNPDVRIGGLIGWGGVGKSALVRKWYDDLEANNIQPDGIFWWGFYRNAYLEQFLNALLRYVTGGQIEPDTIKSTWEKTDRIKEYISQGTYLIILDGLEQMQKAEAGDEFGKMIHRELTELLHYLADVPNAGGMCLITTRFPLKDLDDWKNRGYENRPLIDLSAPDALLMLEKRGIKGSDEEMKGVIKRYKGHALSLTSLAGYLVRYYDGDIKEAPDIKFVLSDKERFKDVNKLLSKYAEKMSEAEQRFLNIFSLFRQEITEDDFDGVFRKEIEGTKFNDVLVKMSKLDFADLVNGLVDWRLISYDEAKKTYATHPLIKAYFESDFSKKDKKLCHKRIYEYIGGYAPEKPETLEEMEPLFEQVYHGCAAGLYDEVFNNIYLEKIGGRTTEYEITHKLGAWEVNLSLVRSFFPKGELSQIPFVSKKSDQSLICGVAGLALLCTGRPKEAEELLVRKTNMQIEIEDKDWENLSVGYQTLAYLQFQTSEIEAGLDSAKKALEMAEKAESDEDIMAARAFLGWILHLMGKDEEAGNQFRQADELEGKRNGHRLCSGYGVFYADFLMSMRGIDEAFELTRRNLEICENQHWPNDISRCHRCLGAIERIKGNYEEAEVHLQDALDICRKVGMPALEIEALLETGRLRVDMGRFEDAVRDADQALKICARTGFRLYEPGAEMVLAKAYLGLKDFVQAERFAHSAYEKAVGMKYRWAEGDAADLLGEIYSVRGDKAKGRKWLKKAVGCRKEILDPKVKETEGKLAGSE
jgi:tetratricopeptide (TPR) repeat protein